MKKLFVPLVVLFICAFILTGCGTSSPTPTTPAAAQPSVTKPASVSPTAVNPTAVSPATVSPATTKPAATTAPATKPAATIPVSGTAPAYGGIIRNIDPLAPATPLGIPWETSGNSVLSMQLSLQCALKEYVDGSIGPNLATSYDVVADPANPSVTLRFQKGIKFSDGTDLNAQAVKWNYDKMKVSNMYPSVTSYWKSVDVLDDYTLKINFTTWLNKSLGSFAKSVTYLISPTAFEKNGIDWMRWNMVGTGPYLQTNFQRDVSLTTVKNTNYWEQGRPYLDKVQYLFVADEMTRLALFKSGGAEILNTNVNGRVAVDLQNAGYTIVTQPRGVAILAPDSANADSPWSNLKVRQAADYAIDKVSIANTFGFGFWAANDQMNTSNSVAYDKNIPGRKYDVAKAKQLLTEAGYPNGFKTTIIAPNYANPDIVATLQSYLGKVGIQCNIQMAASALFNTYTNTAGVWNNALIFYSYSQNPNPTQGFNGSFGAVSSSFKSTARPPGWRETLDAAMISAKLEPALIQKVERLAYDDVMTIALYSETNMWAVTTNVQDSGLGTRGDPNFWEPQNTWLKK